VLGLDFGFGGTHGIDYAVKLCLEISNTCIYADIFKAEHIYFMNTYGFYSRRFFLCSISTETRKNYVGQ
jgi:hypothetical protein